MLVNVSVEPLSFVKVTDSALLVFPTATDPKLSELLESVTGAVPVPERDTDCGLSDELLVTVNFAVNDPNAAGVKVTWIVQLAEAARVLGLRGQLLVDE